MNVGPVEWDAETYERVSDPQYEWGLEVLDRLELAGDEFVMDAGCGSGRVTEKLLERLPRGRVLAVDASESMIEKAHEKLGDRVDYLVADLAELKLSEPVDVVFSTATFHWISDHDRLFARLHEALLPGGRLHAQCGGVGNVRKHAEAIVRVAQRPEFAPHFADMEVLWNFAGPEETERRLDAAGFTDVHAWLQPKPVRPADPREFMRVVTLGLHLSRLPADLQDPFIDAVAAEMPQPVVLNYVRLNIDAQKPK
jgi:trans-aconitate 2-methyltransferase